ncbi:MAG: thioredoxin domain-containing protein [Acidobacteriales bacterium]|nr:thioredoxin domain-containing protein [Terriglobales bacterium]
MRLVKILPLLLLIAMSAAAQQKSKAARPAKAATPVPEKLSVLRPPAGAKVAIVMFEDLQCPDCGRAWPLVHDVARRQNVPVVLYDFPLAMHNWSFDAAVWARYFDTKSKKLGDGFRGYLYASQISITPLNLLDYVRRYAESNNVQIPMVPDPGGKMAEKIRADYALGQRIGVQHTPTIWVVGAVKNKPEPFVEIVDRSQLSSIIEDMKRQAGSK